MAARRWIKWIAIALVAIVLLFFAVVATALALVDTRALRGVIEERVETTTGRELRIEGSLDIALFPWLGFELGRTRLANAQGFGDAPFAALEQVQLRVRLLPLIQGDIALDRIVLNGLELNLARDANGQSNWDDLVAEAPGDGRAEGKPDAEGTGAAPAAGWSLSVDGVEVRDARATWRDAGRGQQVTVRELEVLAGRLEPGVATPVELSFTAAASGAPELELAADGQLTYRLDGPGARVAGLEVELDARGEALPGGRVTAGLAGDLAVDAGAGRATLDNVVITALDRLRATGRIESGFAGAETSIAGRLAIEEFNPRKLASALAVELPPTADGNALTRAELELSLAGRPAAMRLERIEGHIDATRISGSATAALADVPRLRADLEADRIDLDRYMPPSGGSAGGGSSGAGSDSGSGDAAADPVANLPVEALRGVFAELHAGIGEALYRDLAMSDVRLDARIEDGILHLDHAGLATAGGRIEASGRLDGRSDAPALSLDAGIRAVQAEPLLVAFAGAAPIVGKLDTGLSGKTRGGTLEAWIRALDGRFDATFLDGAVRGLNVAQRIRVLGARLSGGDVETAKAERKTDFSMLRMSGRIRDGVLSSDQLDLRSPLLRLSGAGEADLGKRTVDYTARVLITSTLAGQGGGSATELAGLEVPMRIKGAWASPGIDIKLEKALERRARAEAEAEIEEKKEAAEAEAGREEQKQRKKLDKKEEEAEEELKEEVEGLFD